MTTKWIFWSKPWHLKLTFTILLERWITKRSARLTRGRFKPRYNSAPHRPTSPLPILWSRVLQETWNPQSRALESPWWQFPNGIPSDRQVHPFLWIPRRSRQSSGYQYHFFLEPNKKRNKKTRPEHMQDIPLQHAKRQQANPFSYTPQVPLSRWSRICPSLRRCPNGHRKATPGGLSNWISISVTQDLNELFYSHSGTIVRVNPWYTPCSHLSIVCKWWHTLLVWSSKSYSYP